MSPWLELCFKHSHPLKLEVVVDVHLDHEDGLELDPLQVQKDRIRTLDVSLFEERWSRERTIKCKNVLRFLGTDMPALEELTLSGCHDNSDPTLRSSPLLNSAPHLKSLEVRNFNLKLRPLPYQDLVNLSLLYEQGYLGALSFPILFDLLCAAPLHTLVLQHALRDEETDNQVDHISPIPVLSLQSLTLDLPAYQCIKLLSGIRLQPSCRTKICGWSVVDHELGIQPQELLDRVLCVFDDAPKLIGIKFEITQTSVSMDLKRDGPECLGVRFARSRGTDSSWLSLPSPSSFPDVWWVELAGPAQRDGPAAKGLVSMWSSLPSLERVNFPVQFLPVFSGQMHDNPKSFAKLTSIYVSSIKENFILGDLGDLTESLARHNKFYHEGDGTTIGLQLKGGSGWAEEEVLLEVLDNLRDLSDLQILEE
ncbi:hypothetical protein BDN72DRAFT_859457 [Pluteus cervinus]|uniref:Uncharacterized protein n=1 Tax=Pluteus cervinus TaxID=181527 RepID=A0ACD3AP53_9AGAR|nr:hypothetical protein BDN72DRAFT_859457 [Pluteus cervinus]